MMNKILAWNFVSGKSGKSGEMKVSDFPQLGFSGRPRGPPPSVRDLGLYLRLNKELEKGSFSNVVFCYSYSNKLLLPFLTHSDWFCAQTVRDY